VLRYQSEDQPAKIPLVVLLFVLDSLLFAFSYTFNFPYWALGVCGFPCLCTFIYLCTQKTVDMPKTFKCPLVPLVPCVGMLINIYLIATLPIDAIYRVLIWTAIGLAIYFGYGIRHSVLRTREVEDKARAYEGEGEVYTVNE